MVTKMKRRQEEKGKETHTAEDTRKMMISAEAK
jgi:hypothetical protein